MIKKMQQIKDAVDKYYGINIADKPRTSFYVKARCHYYFIVQKLLPHTSSITTGMLVNRDHATVLHGRKIHEQYFVTDNDYAETALELLYSLDHLKAPKNYVLDNNLKDVVKINLELKNKILKLEKELQKYKINKPRIVLKPITERFNELSQLSDAELTEFKETRIKPFLMMLKSRKKHKEIKNVIGARILR